MWVRRRKSKNRDLFLLKAWRKILTLLNKTNRHVDVERKRIVGPIVQNTTAIRKGDRAATNRIADGIVGMRKTSMVRTNVVWAITVWTTDPTNGLVEIDRQRRGGAPVAIQWMTRTTIREDIMMTMRTVTEDQEAIDRRKAKRAKEKVKIGRTGESDLEMIVIVRETGTPSFRTYPCLVSKTAGKKETHMKPLLFHRWDRIPRRAKRVTIARKLRTCLALPFSHQSLVTAKTATWWRKNEEKIQYKQQSMNEEIEIRVLRKKLGHLLNVGCVMTLTEFETVVIDVVSHYGKAHLLVGIWMVLGTILAARPWWEVLHLNVTEKAGLGISGMNDGTCQGLFISLPNKRETSIADLIAFATIVEVWEGINQCHPIVREQDGTAT
jgi:hypothetical protein